MGGRLFECYRQDLGYSDYSLLGKAALAGLALGNSFRNLGRIRNFLRKPYLDLNQKRTN
jgi:hypothetical protein